MSPALERALRWSVVVAGVVGFPVLVHYSAATSAASASPSLALAVALAPPLTIIFWLAWQSPKRLVWLLTFAAVGVLLWGFWGALEKHLGWVYLLQHLGTNAMLAALFGLTLTPGRRPLCTRVAEAVRGDLDAEAIRYTRQITLAWTLFFLAVTLVSATLFWAASIAVWSIFANLLWGPLILFMFAGEYLVRLHRLPHLEHRGILDGIRAFRGAAKVSPGTSPHAP